MKENKNMNRTLKVLIGAAFISLASLSMASAQTGSLQGARLFLYDGGIGTTLNRIGLFTPMDTSLSLNYNLTLPPNSGSAGDFLYTPDGLGTLAFTNGNGLFWRLDGNSGTTPWNGATGNFVGSSDAVDLVVRSGGDNDIQFWNGSTSTMKMNINSLGNVGIGLPANPSYRFQAVDISGNYNGGIFQISRPGGIALSAANFAPGGIGLWTQATDVGVSVGQYITPLNGMEIDASAVGILINKYGTAPAVGISMDGSATGLLIENSIFGVAIDGSTTALYIRNTSTAIDAEGTTNLNVNFGSSTNINTGTSTGAVSIGNASAGILSMRSGSDIMIQVDGGGSGDDLVLTGIDGGASTTKILTLDAANNVRYRTVSSGTSIITGSGTLNYIPKWTPDGMTLANSSISDNGSLVTVANALSQTGVGQVTFSGNVDANNGLDVTGPTTHTGTTSMTGATTQTGTLGVTGATTINTSGAALTTLGAVGNTVQISANDVEMANLPSGATSDDLVTISGSDIRRVVASTYINANAWKLGGNASPGSNIFGTTSATDVVMQTNNVTRLTLTSAGAITQTGTGQVTFTGDVDANNGLDVTGPTTHTGTTTMTGATTQTGSLGITGAITANTTGSATTAIGNTASGGTVNISANNDITINPGAGTGDVVLNNIDLDATTTNVLTLDASNNVRYRSISGGSSILTGSGANNTVAKWTPDGMTLGNSSITDNGSLVTVANALSQTGGGQVTFSGPVDANNGLDVTGPTTHTGTTSMTGATTQTGTLGVTGATTINTSGAALTTLGAIGNTVRIAASDVEMTNLPGGATTDELVTISGSDVRRVAASTFTNANAWKLGGNSSPVSNIFGTTSATDVIMQTSGATRLTLTAAGAITQTGAGQVTLTGNVDANAGLDVTGTTSLTGLTTQTGIFNVTGATGINSTGGSTTSIGNTTVGGTVSIYANADITINPGPGTGNVVLHNIDLDGTTTKLLMLDGSDNVRYRTISSGSSIITGTGTANQVARWTPDGVTLGNSVITDDGSNVGISTTGTITIASTSTNDVTINVSGGASNDLVLTGIDTDNTTTKVLTLDAGNNVRVHTIGGGGSSIVTGAGTLNTIPKWTPDGYTLGDSKLTDNGTTVAVDGSAAFNANGNVTLGDVNTDDVTIKGNLKVLAAPNQFAGRHLITGGPGVTTFVIPNTLVTPGSIILVTLEDGTNVANLTATVSAKTAGASFTVRLSSVMTPGQTKYVNYQIINQ